MNFYKLGVDEALQALGVMPGAPAQEHALDADAFAQFAEQDRTDENIDNGVQTSEPAKGVDKKPAWSGGNSLESGDVGTRNYQMGLPRSGAV